MKDEEIIVYKVSVYKNGGYFQQHVKYVIQAIEDLDDGEAFTIRKLTMLKSEYEKLPEFKGF